VNAVGPTPIDTDLIKNVPGNKIEELKNRQCIKRLGNTPLSPISVASTLVNCSIAAFDEE